MAPIYCCRPSWLTNPRLDRLNTRTDDIPVPGLDPVAAQRWLALARTHSPWLHEEVARRMGERLQWFKEKPQSWLHWEPVLGGLQAHRDLVQRLPQAQCRISAVDRAGALKATGRAGRRHWNPLRWVRSDDPSADLGEPVGMVWANMGLHLVPRPQALLRQWQQRIQTGGFLMFSCLGPDSLRELRTLYAQQGWPAPTHVFTDMHDWGDMLVHSGFAEPVMDMERIFLSFSSAAALLEELRGLGRNGSAERGQSLRGRGWRRELESAIEKGLPRGEDGRLRLGFEIIYGHAFKAPERAARSDSHTVSLEEMRVLMRDRRS